MYILQESDHILTKLFKSFFVGFEIYVAVDLIGGPTQSNLSLGFKDHWLYPMSRFYFIFPGHVH